MGPINESWIKEYGNDWSMGRIDVDGIAVGPFGVEYPVPPMKREDWNEFGKWLSALETKDAWTLKELLTEYEMKNKTIIWLKAEDFKAEN